MRWTPSFRQRCSSDDLDREAVIVAAIKRWKIGWDAPGRPITASLEGFTLDALKAHGMGRLTRTELTVLDGELSSYGRCA
jgi:hypothetical protein